MPRPIIFHVDVNSAFLSWEACHQLNENPEATDIRLVPSIIGGRRETRHGVVLAKSIPASKAGIKTGEPIVHALKKCPNLLIFPPDFSIYRSRSEALMELFRTYAPCVQQLSIDEAYLDMSGTEILYGDPVAFAHRLREEVREKLGFTVNIGISTNKLLAKMASDFEKPDKVHTLFPEEIPQKMWPLPVSNLLFAGKSSVQKLHNLGIFTIGELAAADPVVLQQHLKSHGRELHKYANGIDTSPVEAEAEAAKGYSNSITLPFDITDRDDAKGIMLSLCENIGARIRKDNAFISVVSVTIVDMDFRKTSHQVSLSEGTNITAIIYEHACMLFDKLWDLNPIRLIGVHTSKASDENYTQFSLFDTDKNEKLEKLDMAIDSIRLKYGDNAIKRARLMRDDR
ncbi:MAG: DNA polymerase IV [Lachnospiraceae bacterium]|nr:DNA polymerase IV [Lachnospiraceae bacterium]